MMARSSDYEEDGEHPFEASTGQRGESSSSWSSRRMVLHSMDDLPTDDSVSLSSSEDDDADSDSSDVESSSSSKEVQHFGDSNLKTGYDEMDQASSTSESSDSSTDEDEERQNRVLRTTRRMKRWEGEALSSSDDDDDEYRSDKHVQAHAPLEDRLRQQQEAATAESRATSSIRAAARERKSRALKVASERLQKHQRAAVVESANRDKDGDNEGAVVPQHEKKKRSKHAPTEASSKRSDFFQRGAPALDSSGVGVEITARRYKPRDPRLVVETANTAGEAAEGTAALDQKFAFLQEMRQKEIAALKKKITVCKLSGKKGQKARKKLGVHRDSLESDQAELKRLLEQEASYNRAQLDATAKRAVKRKLKEQVAAGKQGVYYPKKREMKRMQLEAKFEELRKRGGNAAVDKALARRRKKQKSKDTGHFVPKDMF